MSYGSGMGTQAPIDMMGIQHPPDPDNVVAAMRDAQRRRERVVPAVVDVLAMDRVPCVVV